MSSTWPPPSLEVNAKAIADECEFAEVSTIQRTLLAPVHMAALIYLGEQVHARHLWRRTSVEDRDELLNDWWEVAKLNIQGKDVSEALQKCSHHPSPLNTYASEIAAAPPTKKKEQTSMQLNQQIVSFLETKRW
eukprot:CAMPEP_0194165804 /NCGR_PEP_ID=MMETSP0154-20130528/1625_1 /TAXON_ID=1049557 /ORGANISM="Thalassiothrix antarctica, Strain L6-D1" /LENGTH=133 /DNA_ID=CAMNT_0038876339 /DNA_START=50 /DNA_END=448 /DNA_ORIENTATION=+